MDLYVGRSSEDYNFVGTIFVADAGMDLFSEKVQICEGCFFSREEAQRGGGG